MLHHVEIVDGHVHEDAAGGLYVGEGRRGGVPGSDLDDLHVPDAAGGDHFAHALKIPVKPAVEAHLVLDARFLDRLQHRLDLAQVVVDGLFTEDVLSGLRRLDGDGRMGVGGGAEEDRVDFRVVQNVMIIRRSDLYAQFFRQFFRRRKVHIRDRRDLRVRHPVYEVCRVKLADAPRADDPDP